MYHKLPIIDRLLRVGSSTAVSMDVVIDLTVVAKPPL